MRTAISIPLTRFASSCPSGLLGGPSTRVDWPLTCKRHRPRRRLPRSGESRLRASQSRLSRTQCLLARLPLPSALGLPSRIPTPSATKPRPSILPSPHALSQRSRSSSHPITRPHPRRPPPTPNRGQATRLQSLVEGVKSRRAGPRIPHGNGAARGRKCPRRGQFADTSRTPVTDTSWTLLALGRPLGLRAVGRLLAGQTPLRRSSPDSQESSHSGGRAAFIQLHTRHATATGDATHQATRSRPRNKSSANRSPFLKLAGPRQSPPHPSPQSHLTRPAPDPSKGGQAHRLRTLVEGAESGRAEP